MMGKKDCKSQTSKMPAVKESPRYNEKNAPMNPQPYGCLSKTSIMTMRVDTPPKIEQIPDGPTPGRRVIGCQWLRREGVSPSFTDEYLHKLSNLK